MIEILAKFVLTKIVDLVGASLHEGLELVRTCGVHRASLSDLQASFDHIQSEVWTFGEMKSKGENDVLGWIHVINRRGFQDPAQRLALRRDGDQAC